MGIEELNFSSAVLQGSAFASLADLVADLAGQTDPSTNSIGLTYRELQNLIKSFGFETVAGLGRQQKIDASGSLFWTLPMSEVQKLDKPVVFGTELVSAVLAPKNGTLRNGDFAFYEGLIHGYHDISVNKTTQAYLEAGSMPQRLNQKVLMTDAGVSAGFGINVSDQIFPNFVDTIDWFDLSSVVKAKNIRFDNNSNTTDISAIRYLFSDASSHTLLNNEDTIRSGHRLNDLSNAQVMGKALTNGEPPFGVAKHMDVSYSERDRDYLNFLNLFEPTPTYKQVANCGLATVAPYLEAGLFKSNVGYGLNKEYLTTAATMKAVIRNNVRGSNAESGALGLKTEFQILKDYGFPKSKVYEAYGAELAYGVSGSNGVAYSGAVAASTFRDNVYDSPANVQELFTAVYGTAGTLADQLSEFETMDTFNDASGGVTLEQLKAASDVKSWVQYIEKVKEFVASDQDFTWSTKGMVAPSIYKNSEKEEWDNFQEVLKADPRLTHLPNISLTTGQDERLRILLETIESADASYAPGSVAADKTVNLDLSFSSWTQNNMTLALTPDVSNTAVYIKDGKIMDVIHNVEVDTNSIWKAAIKHGWSDATEVYGNLKGSGLFMMDSQYNVRSRIKGLDKQGQHAEVGPAVRDQWASHQDPSWLRKDQLGLDLSGGDFDISGHYAAEYFTPGHFQDAFFDANNLQHTANVMLRYFDLDTSATVVSDDVSLNVTNIDSIVTYSLPLKSMDLSRNSVPSGKYAADEQHRRIGFVYNELVRKAFPNNKAAIAEITSWRPVPPSLYVDVSDVTGFKESETRVKDARAAGDIVYSSAQGIYDNFNLPGAMVHVMTNYFAKGSVLHNTNSDADLITLLDLHPAETLRAINAMSAGLDISNGTLFTIENKTGIFTPLDSTHDTARTISRILRALVHYGKPASHFGAVGATARLAINAYEDEVKKWATDMGNSMGVFGDDADVFSMVQHLGYWIPYLTQYTPAQIAEEAASDDDIQNISDEARSLMLGLLLSATRGTLASSRPGDAAARIAGLNAFHAAGIPKTLIDIAYTTRGINVFANLTGSNYDQ